MKLDQMLNNYTPLCLTSVNSNDAMYQNTFYSNDTEALQEAQLSKVMYYFQNTRLIKAEK